MAKCLSSRRRNTFARLTVPFFLLTEDDGSQWEVGSCSRAGEHRKLMIEGQIEGAPSGSAGPHRDAAQVQIILNLLGSVVLGPRQGGWK